MGPHGGHALLCGGIRGGGGLFAQVGGGAGCTVLDHQHVSCLSICGLYWHTLLGGTILTTCCEPWSFHGAWVLEVGGSQTTDLRGVVFCHLGIGLEVHTSVSIGQIHLLGDSRL